MNNIVLHVDDVHKSFGGLHALSDVNLDIRRGRDARDHRAERRRQIDAAQRLRRAAGAEPGQGGFRRHRS